MHNSALGATDFTITSLTALFQSSSCIMNETYPLHSSIIINSVLNAFSAYTAIMLNILTIHAMRKTSSLPKPLETLLLSLAVSDLGVGLLAQPLFIVWMVNPTSFTYAAFNAQIIFTVASFLSVVAISVERFLAIHLHLRYQELVTHKRVIVVVISIWILSVLYGPLSLFFSLKTPVYVILYVILGFSFIITGLIYYKIYSTVQHHANQIQVLEMQVAQLNSQTESAARQRKSAVSTLYVYLVYLFCCLPEYCVRLTFLISSRSSVYSVLKYLWFYTLTLFFLNSSLNPVIYCWKMRHIRQAIINTLRNIFPKQNQANL